MMDNLIIDSQAEQTNPADAAVVADTGAITKPGFYEVRVVASASANSQYELQHRNAANDANVSDGVGFYVPANTPAEFSWLFYINDSERVRVVMDDALTGTCWVSVAVWRVA